MVSLLLAGVLAMGVAGTVGFGVVKLMRPRRMTIVDYPELPAPPANELVGEGDPELAN